jgi:hypothetical protein
VFSSAYGPQKSKDASPPLSADTASDSTPSVRPDILESVLIQTFQSENLDQPLDKRELEALREVARRYRDQPLTLEPVAVALVQAVICPQIQADSSSWDFWRGVITQIAQTQLDDPATHQRLQSLWAEWGGRTMQ